jgi:phospholipid/cholesterol/gamma-HCH transport system permease protein
VPRIPIRTTPLPTAPSLSYATERNEAHLQAAGAWTAAAAQTIEALTDSTVAQIRGSQSVRIDIAAIEELDTYGAWLIERLIRRCKSQGLTAEMRGVPERFKGLLEAVHETVGERMAVRKRAGPLLTTLEAIGRTFPQLTEDLSLFSAMLGALAAAIVKVILHPRRFRLTSAVHHLDRVGWQAMPIMLLISVLIGAIIAQQGIFHFRKFGADIYVVDLVGILVLRELGVLLIAIMSAGRSGSSYTAELGSMKMREEIDALRTMGLDPVEVLMLPRIIALVIAMPILTFFGSLAALYGGGLIIWLYGGMSPEIFIARLQEAVSVTSFKVGIIKAPFMGLVIGVVACSEGLRVKGSAESLGLQTTTSVVKSIFLVIVLDGLFAVFFASIGM